MEVAQHQDLQQEVIAEGELVAPCTAPDPSVEAKLESKPIETAITEVDQAPIEPTVDTVIEEAKPNDEPATIEADAPVEAKQEEAQQPIEQNAFEAEKQAPAATVSEEAPNESDTPEEVAIIKQKRKFDAIQDEASAAEENVAKKIKFEE